MTRSWKNSLLSSDASTLLLLLLATDFALFLLHFLLISGVFEKALLSLETDRGYAEFFQYIKESWIVILLLSMIVRSSAIGYGAWAFLFLYLLLDDALQIHERFGGPVAEALHFAPSIGLRAKDFGELTISAMAAALILPWLLFFYLRSPASFRQTTRHLATLVLALAFFGVLGDMLHSAVDMGKGIGILLGVIEDGGEMIVMSIILTYVYSTHTALANKAV